MTSTYKQVKPSKSTQSKIQVDKKEMNLPASWYVALPSKDLEQKPITIELFGRSLVAWRDQNNQPVIMEPYCSHIGANLALGKVIDGCIQCPFHHWRYDSSGQCVVAPEVEDIPPTARQTTYVTTEKYGYIWVWYGSATPLFPLPKYLPAEDESHNYMALRFINPTTTTVRNLIENLCDYYHVVPQHGQQVSGPIQFNLLNDQYTSQDEIPIQKDAWVGTLIEYPVDGSIGRLGFIGRALGLNGQVMKWLMNCWPSGGVVAVFMDNQEKVKVLVGSTPVNENITIAHSLVTIRKTGKFWLDIIHFWLFSWQFKTAIKEDLLMLNNMNSAEGRAYVKHDLGILKFRQLYQRWIDKVE